MRRVIAIADACFLAFAIAEFLNRILNINE